MSATDWITPGTEVITYSKNTFPSPIPHRSVIEEVTGDTFKIQGLDAAFKFGPSPTSTGKRDRWGHIRVAPLDSDFARELLRQEHIEKLVRGALLAVVDWRDGLDLKNVTNLDATIASLQALRRAL